MTSQPTQIPNNPWPEQTPSPPTYSSSSSHHTPRSPKRRRKPQDESNNPPPQGHPPATKPSSSLSPPSISSSQLRALSSRQVLANQAQIARAKEQCQVFSGNDVFSCFPTSGISVPQGEYTSFVWNSRRPELTQTNLVDIFLFRADSQQQVLHAHNIPNPRDQAGVYNAQVNDTWFGADGLKFSGRNVSFPFYWVIIRADKTLDGNQIPQTIFSAVQTTVLDSVASSSAAAAAASSSSLLSASLASRTATATNSSPSGNVQPASSSNSFPRWAIAVIVVLGFLAIAATCILVFLILRRLRRRREREDSARNSMGSSSPMMPGGAQGHGVGGATSTVTGGDVDREMVQNYTGEGSQPLLPPTVLAGGVAGSSTTHSHGHSHYGGGGPGGTSHSHDGASTISGDGAGGLFSGADAAIMADAFRKMLRKPEFPVGGVEEGGNGYSDEDEGVDGSHRAQRRRGTDDSGTLESPTRAGHEVLSRELAEEGRDIRSVASSRGVRVEGTDTDTIGR